MEQAEAAYGGRREQLESERDRKQIAILQALTHPTTHPEER